MHKRSGMSMNIEELFKELAAIPEVEAIAMGGSRAGSVYDEKSERLHSWSPILILFLRKMV